MAMADRTGKLIRFVMNRAAKTGSFPRPVLGRQDRFARSPHGVRHPTQRRTLFRQIAAVQDFVLDLFPRETASGGMYCPGHSAR